MSLFVSALFHAILFSNHEEDEKDVVILELYALQTNCLLQNFFFCSVPGLSSHNLNIIEKRIKLKSLQS